MALSVIVKQITQKTSTGNQAYTGFGFQPKVIILWGNKLTTNASGADAVLAFGVAISSSDRRCMCHSGQNAGLGGKIFFSNVLCYAVIDTDTFATVRSKADFVSMDADGFTLNWTTADATARLINVLAIGGTTLTNVISGQDTARITTTGTKATTGVGFQPDAVIFFATPGTSATTSGGANAQNLIGWSTASASESVSGFMTNSQNPSIDTCTEKATSYTSQNGSTVGQEATLQSMDADGFTLNWTTVSASASFFYFLALKGVNAKVGNFNQKTSTGNQSTTGIGFQPSAILFNSFNNASSSSILANDERSFGVGVSSSVRACTWMGSTNNQASQIANSDIDNTKIIKLMSEGVPTVNAAADLVSLDSDGWTLNWTTADGTAREITYLAIGAPAAGGGRHLSTMPLLGAGYC